MKKIALLSGLLLLLNAMPGQAQQRKQSDEQLYLQSMHKYITSDKLYNYVKHLSDSTIFEGRLAGSPGMGRAVEWAQGLFKEWGLEQLPGTTDYLQIYSHPCSEVKSAGFSLSLPVVKTEKRVKKRKRPYTWRNPILGLWAGMPEAPAAAVPYMRKWYTPDSE